MIRHTKRICHSFFRAERTEYLDGELYAIFAIGYTDETPAARPRKRIEEVTEWRGGDFT